MNTTLMSLILLGSLAAMILLGRKVRRILPDDHLNSDSRDTVKLAMGLVATMTALLLGLLVSSAKGTYDTQRTEVIQMASKVAFMDRMLASYGPETATVRAEFRDGVAEIVNHMWPDEARTRVRLDPDAPAGDRIYAAIQGLTPRDDTQRGLKTQAVAVAAEIGQLRMLILAQAVPSIPLPLLIMVGCWLLIIFVGFSLLAPPNATTAIALTSAAVSVAGAVFLIMELDQPLGGVIRISNAPMLKALDQLAK